MVVLEKTIFIKGGGDSVSVDRGELTCIFCGALLRFNSELAFYSCPDCGAEFWPGGGELWTGTDNDSDSLGQVKGFIKGGDHLI